LPETSTKQNPTAQLKTILAKMERMDYYQILGASPEDDERTIRKKFYARSKKYHPDRYHYVDNPTFKQLITEVYKNIAEAYNILKEPKVRHDYDQALREDRAANLRWSPQKAEQDKKPYDGGTGPGAKYYRLAQQAVVARNWANARNNIKLALSMEPDNEHFQALRDEIETHG